MENYIVHKYAQKDLSLLKNDWRLLETGKDMSYFQTYDWYNSINDIIPNKGEVVFLKVTRNGNVILIAPLWILRKTYLFINKRGVYFWGKDGYSDYLNFIYSEFDEKSLETLFSFIKEEYRVTHYYLEFLQDSLDVVSYLERYLPRYNKVSFNYAAINLPNTVEIYSSNLSKHVRQNLRTARNRMIKDGLNFESTLIEGDIDNSIRRMCETIRKERLPLKIQSERKKWSLKTKLHMFLDEKLRIHFPYASVIDTDKNGRFLLVTCGDDIAAFFYYGYEANKKRILIMTAGTNQKYVRYSPGFYYMYQQIKKWIEDDSVVVVDFTRGGEQYKYYLGCDKYPVCNMSFVI